MQRSTASGVQRSALDVDRTSKKPRSRERSFISRKTICSRMKRREKTPGEIEDLNKLFLVCSKMNVCLALCCTTSSAKLVKRDRQGLTVNFDPFIVGRCEGTEDGDVGRQEGGASINFDPFIVGRCEGTEDDDVGRQEGGASSNLLGRGADRASSIPVHPSSTDRSWVDMSRRGEQDDLGLVFELQTSLIEHEDFDPQAKIGSHCVIDRQACIQRKTTE
ncbi:hypothetical protein K438DRAFT_692612 [Mycena galopus ATCC 62051]|nr:hypothetical protein K438DRAFT_692612 [Mycena galopus ATCC 62051]